MAEFIFMLTHNDRTVDNAFELVEETRDLGLRFIGFKDVGLSFDRLKQLTEAIHLMGQEVMLEVVSVSKEDELRSVAAGIELGVDYLLGGTHAEAATELLNGTNIRYCPFPGKVVGHPSLLRGTLEEIAESARVLGEMPGVFGLDLLAYRFDGMVTDLVRSVVSSATGPVIAAGSIDCAEKISLLSDLGVWGFTVGSAILEKRFVEGGSIRSQLQAVLAAAAISTAVPRTM